MLHKGTFCFFFFFFSETLLFILSVVFYESGKRKTTRRVTSADPNGFGRNSEKKQFDRLGEETSSPMPFDALSLAKRIYKRRFPGRRRERREIIRHAVEKASSHRRESWF